MNVTGAAAPDLVSALTRIRQTKREILRREVIETVRIDLLATRLLGYELRPFHRELLEFQSAVADTSLQLAPRGFGGPVPNPVEKRNGVVSGC